EAISVQVSNLNEKIKTATDNKTRRKAQSLKKQLQHTECRINKYERQIRTSGNRSGYNTTDEDASAMMMKNKVEVLPAYNVVAGCEDQLITGISLHQNTNDGSCFKDHLDRISSQQPIPPQNIIADSIFGTEQNYELLESKDINNYVKFPYFHLEQKKSYNNN